MLQFLEIIVVDDGSSDRTAEIAAGFAHDSSHIRVLKNPGNRGKGYTVRHGMMEGRGEWLLFSDADLSTPMEELEKLWSAIEGTPYDGAIGSRALDRSLIGIHQPGLRETAGKFFNTVMRAVIGLPYRDTQCGFKLFRRDFVQAVFPRQKLDGFGFDVEVLYIARKLGFQIAEVPVRWNHAENSRVGTWNGLQAFLELAQIRWNALRGLYR